MRSLFQPACVLVVVSAASVLFLSGCGQSDSASSESATAANDENAAGHNHAGWWCTEHGVPEEECAQCDASLVAAFKEKDDWCEEHSRPDSQCFICDSERADKFAARFTAKFGEEPPQRTE